MTDPTPLDLDDAEADILNSMASDDRQTRAEYQAGCKALSALLTEHCPDCGRPRATNAHQEAEPDFCNGPGGDCSYRTIERLRRELAEARSYLTPAERARLIDAAVEQRRRAENARGDVKQLRAELADSALSTAEREAVEAVAAARKARLATFEDFQDSGVRTEYWRRANIADAAEDNARQIVDELLALRAQEAKGSNG